MTQSIKNKFAKFSIYVSCLIAIVIFSVYSMGAGSQKYIIYTDASTSGNDSAMSSGWIPITGATNVAIFYSTDDTAYVKGTVEYRYGSETEIVLAAADTLSLVTYGTANAGLSKGKILQGYGLATSLIPGANAIRVKLNRQFNSETSIKIHCGLIYN